MQDAQERTISFDTFRDYIRISRGEFSVAKNIFVALQTGWFSDRSAAYLASGRPVILQDTGFSRHLPAGEGLFAVNSLEEAAAAVAEVETDYARHSKAARHLAEDCLAAKAILPKFLSCLGVA